MGSKKGRETDGRERRERLDTRNSLKAFDLERLPFSPPLFTFFTLKKRIVCRLYTVLFENRLSSQNARSSVLPVYLQLLTKLPPCLNYALRHNIFFKWNVASRRKVSVRHGNEEPHSGAGLREPGAARAGQHPCCALCDEFPLRGDDARCAVL